MRKRLASIEVADQLDIAFSKIDETGARLDKLKKAYNDTANEMSQISYDQIQKATTPPPAPAAAPAVPPMPAPPLPTGYSVTGEVSSEKPLPPRPRVPRPDPRPAKVAPPPVPKAAPPKPTTSGRFYIQLTGAENPEGLRQLRDKLGKVGRVVDSGRGTASSPGAEWVEVAVRADTAEVIAALKEVELKERVEKIIEVKPGEGRLLARQLDIFHLKRSHE